MALSCGAISKNIVGSLCGASVAALDNEIILVNFDDIDRAQSQVADGVIKTLVLKDSKNGYSWTSNQKAFEGTSSLNKGTYATTHAHSVVARLFVNSQDVKTELNKLAQGRVVAIVKNLSTKSDETKYEVYGWESGMILSALDKNTADGDGVIYAVTFSSDDDARESQIPMSFYNTDLATTETALKALLAS